MKAIGRTGARGKYIRIKNDNDRFIATIYPNKMIAFSKYFFYLKNIEVEFILKIARRFDAHFKLENDE